MATVQCKECGEQHYVEDVKFLNIEEDIHGYDVLTFECPATGNETTAYVRG